MTPSPHHRDVKIKGDPSTSCMKIHMTLPTLTHYFLAGPLLLEFAKLRRELVQPAIIVTNEIVV